MAITDTLKAISDPVRRNILDLLKDGKMSAGDIAEKFNLTQATVSYHLSQLKKAGLIVEDKHKNFIYYDLNLSVFEDILVWIEQLGGKTDGEN
ncbi:MAG: autorepressor SdpR family transcription factor [Coprobacillus sp.]